MIKLFETHFESSESKISSMEENINTDVVIPTVQASLVSYVRIKNTQARD